MPPKDFLAQIYGGSEGGVEHAIGATSEQDNNDKGQAWEKKKSGFLKKVAKLLNENKKGRSYEGPQEDANHNNQQQVRMLKIKLT